MDSPKMDGITVIGSIHQLNPSIVLTLKYKSLFSEFNAHNCPGYQSPKGDFVSLRPEGLPHPPRHFRLAISPTAPKVFLWCNLLYYFILDRSRQRRLSRRPFFRHQSRPQHCPHVVILRAGPFFLRPPHLQLPHNHRRRRPTSLFQSRQGQGGRVLMGDGELEGGSVFKHLLIQIHPFRKYIWALCALCLLLSLLIILNSVLIISIQGSSPYRLGDPTFVIFSEVLAWLLIMVSVLGIKLTCMSNKIVEANAEAHRRRTGDNGTSVPPPLPSVAIEVDGPDFVGQRRPFSAPQWVNAYWGLSSDGIAGGENPFGLPGVVEPQPPFDPFLFPPPPPRYSSLEGPPIASLGGTRLSPPRPRRPSHHSAQFLRSPPPPYCSTTSGDRPQTFRPPSH